MSCHAAYTLAAATCSSLQLLRVGWWRSEGYSVVRSADTTTEYAEPRTRTIARLGREHTARHWSLCFELSPYLPPSLSLWLSSWDQLFQIQSEISRLDICVNSNVSWLFAVLCGIWSCQSGPAISWRLCYLVSFTVYSVCERFAIWRQSSVCLSFVVSLSVCNVRAPYSGGWNFSQFFYAIWHPSHPLTTRQNFIEIVPGEPLRRRGG